MTDFISKVDGEVESERNSIAAPEGPDYGVGANNLGRQPDIKNFAYEEKIRILEDQVLKFEAEKLER